MGDECPARSRIEALAGDLLSEGEEAALTAHVETCEACAGVLESVARSGWEGMDVRCLAFEAGVADPGGTVAALIRCAQLGAWDSPVDVEALVMSALDRPSGPGMLGRWAGYEVIEVSGRGGMGMVFKARDPTLNRWVALKVTVPLEEAGQGRASEAFLDEARAVAAIRHDHVAELHTAGREHGLLHLVMPFYAEGSLEGWIGRSPSLPVPDTARIGKQLARALAATHARGVLHRDLKPSNVLLDGGIHHVRLADFGLAQTGGREVPGTWGRVVGTPQFVAPETAAGGAYDVRSDLFGLGALLYLLAAGKWPRRGDTIGEVLRAAASDPIPPVRASNPKLPPAFASIVDRLVAFRPEDRFVSADAVVVALERFERTAREGRRVLPGLGWAAGLLLLAAAAVLWLDALGRTAVVNAWLCHLRGDGYHVRGQFGSHARLADAVGACRDGGVVEVRFDGERHTDGFRVGDRSVTLRAARGFVPVLVATNRYEPLILADGPLTLEGLTLAARADRMDPGPLILVEHASLHLLNCRLMRTPGDAEDVLVRGGRRVPPEDNTRTYRPLVLLTSGSMAHLKNCLLLGVHATGIGLGAGQGTLRVEIENSILVIHRALAVRPDADGGARIESRGSVFVTATLLDLWHAPRHGEFSVLWRDSLVDRTGGMLLRWNRAQGHPALERLNWRETNMVYAGVGHFASERRRGEAGAEEPWHRLPSVPQGGHRVTDRGVFDSVLHRSSRRLQAVDLDLDGAWVAAEVMQAWDATWIGEGSSFERFRKDAAYPAWLDRVGATVTDWNRSRRHAPLAP